MPWSQKHVTGAFDSVEEFQVLLENLISMSIKLDVNFSAEFGFEKTLWTTSRNVSPNPH